MRAGWIAAAALAVVFTANGAMAAEGRMPAGVKVENGMLVDAKGMVLYTFDNDIAEGGKIEGQTLIPGTLHGQVVGVDKLFSGTNAGQK